MKNFDFNAIHSIHSLFPELFAEKSMKIHECIITSDFHLQILFMFIKITASMPTISKNFRRFLSEKSEKKTVIFLEYKNKHKMSSFFFPLESSLQFCGNQKKRSSATEINAHANALHTHLEKILPSKNETEKLPVDILVKLKRFQLPFEIINRFCLILNFFEMKIERYVATNKIFYSFQVDTQRLVSPSA